MRASVACFIAVTLSGVLSETHAEGWTSTFSGPQLENSPLAVNNALCGRPGFDIGSELRNSILKFSIKFFKIISVRAKGQCIVTPLSLWLTLAAMAEGSHESDQQELFRMLYLPEDACIRQRFYEMAARSEITGPDLLLHSSRILAVDEHLLINPYWNNLVRTNSLILPISLPIRRDPAAAVDSIRKLIGARVPKADFSGNSLLLGSVDYQGLWAMAFSDKIIKNAPFYDDFGQQIGTVDLMTMKKRVPVAYLSEQEVKVVILPLGRDNRYCAMFGLSVGNTRKSIETFEYEIVAEVLKKVRLSPVPIDVVIPRFSMKTELDLRYILEDIGMKSLWSDPSMTRNISVPPALPSNFIQRATISITNDGVEPYTDNQFEGIEDVSAFGKDGAELEPLFGRDFTANRPFFFALFDTKIYSCLVGTMFSHPPDSHVRIEG